MAQARRKRRTKHRGNAAGVIEARGRTGRKPTVAEKGGKAGAAARARAERTKRYDRPPTWKVAFWRGLFAALALLLASALLLHATAGQAIAYFVVGLVAYTPISYYTDLWLYRRRQRRTQAAAKGRAAPR
jgi:hypothetical protein